MDSAFIHQAANELVQNAGTRNIKQIARSCSLDISETSRIKDMLGLLSLYFDKPLIPRILNRYLIFVAVSHSATISELTSTSLNKIKLFSVLVELTTETLPYRLLF